MGLSSDARRNPGVIPRHDAESRDTGKGEYPQATRFQAPLQAGMTECGLTCPDYPLTIFYYPRPPQNERKKTKTPGGAILYRVFFVERKTRLKLATLSLEG